ncbi:MAG: hypothetical protein WDN45_16555 [Caulobacteraceae bacterium]
MAQKDGYVYTYDQDSHKLVFKAAMGPGFPNHDTSTNTQTPIQTCAGQGQYNGAAYDPRSGLMFAGSQYRCGTSSPNTSPSRPGAATTAGAPSSPPPGWATSMPSTGPRARCGGPSSRPWPSTPA